MRIMVTRTKVYKFAELTDKGKALAKDAWAEHDDFPQGQEALLSLKKFAEWFGCRVYDWQIDYTNSSYSSAKFETPDEGMEEKEIRKLLKELGSYNKRTLHGDGECKLTGVCYDESAIDGFRIAFMRERERDLGRLMEAGFRSWLKDIQSEYEYQYTDEAFAENCEANGYEFTENGERV